MSPCPASDHDFSSLDSATTNACRTFSCSTTRAALTRHRILTFCSWFSLTAGHLSARRRQHCACSVIAKPRYPCISGTYARRRTRRNPACSYRQSHCRFHSFSRCPYRAGTSRCLRISCMLMPYQILFFLWLALTRRPGLQRDLALCDLIVASSARPSSQSWVLVPGIMSASAWIGPLQSRHHPTFSPA